LAVISINQLCIAVGWLGEHGICVSQPLPWSQWGMAVFTALLMIMILLW